MEGRKEKAFNFSYCLFAFLYKKFNEKTEFPICVDYVVPTTNFFNEEIAECVLRISENFKQYLTPFVSKISFQVSKCEENFFDIVKWFYGIISRDIITKSFAEAEEKLDEFNEDCVTSVKILTLCSFISELSLYYLKEKCYFFMPSAPTVLAEIILTLPDTFVDFHTLSCLKDFCEGAAFKKFINSANLNSILHKQINAALSTYSNNIFKNTDFQSISYDKITDLKQNSFKDLSSLTETNLSQSTLFLPKAINVSKRKCENCSELENNVKCAAKRPKKLFFYAKMEENDYSVDEFNPTLNTLKKFKVETSKCLYCRNNCIEYLEDFISEFKETNYNESG